MLSDKATELGRLIGQSSEYQTVKRASDALTDDKAAVAMLERMEQLRVEAQKMMERGEQPTAEMEQELDSLLGQVQTNATYQRVMVANENFDKVMVQVNQWILDGIRKGAASPIITLG
ncbi:MAG: YlbF family regulator [Gemmatimonadetes bacterium]|nr:YlbF family regulator [Gemmatimonadota bacterium]